VSGGRGWPTAGAWRQIATENYAACIVWATGSEGTECSSIAPSGDARSAAGVSSAPLPSPRGRHLLMPSGTLPKQRAGRGLQNRIVGVPNDKPHCPSRQVCG
jgi:hypothetical protein